MSPGKPGAGGAGKRRTGWRRRRRRRRLEAATTAGPDSRGPGTLQGARGMKPVARAARPPRRSPGLRWALPPLLLLLRLGQIACTGDVSDFRVTSVSTMEIGLTRSSNDSGSIKILTTRDGAGEPRNETTANHSIITGGLSPGTKYHFEIFPQGPNGTQGPPQTVEGQTESSVVFGIRVVRVTTTEMELKWQSTDAAFQYTYHLDI
ncbi:receptor-type tyrosine-protein phosphatase eta-like isoform 5-T7 [Trichechus inunguis]